MISNKQTEQRDQASVMQVAMPVSDEPLGIYRVGFAYGRFIYRLRWLVLALWFIGLLVSVPFAAKLGSALDAGSYSNPNSESARADTLVNQKLHQPSSELEVVFQSNTTPVSDPSYQSEVNGFIAQARVFPHVVSVTPAETPGKDGRTTYVTVAFSQTPTLADFQKIVPASATPARAYLTGDQALSDAFTTVATRDTETTKRDVLPFVLIVLLIVFGTLLAALLPLVLGLVAVPVALAVIYIIALHTSVSVYVLNVVTSVGLGISIDYSLFMVRRFREELTRGRSVGDAVGWMVATSGESILFSGLTVIIGFCGLLLMGVEFMSAFGIGGICVVGAAMLAALTLLPALLGVVGTRINALRIPLLGRLTAPKDPAGQMQHGFWHRWALGVMKRPVLVIVAVTALLVVFALPVLSLNIGTPNLASMPADNPAMQGLTILNQQYPQTTNDPIEVVVQSPDGSNILSATNLAKVNALTVWLAAQPHVTSVASITRPETVPGAEALSAQQLAALYTSGAYAEQPGLARFVASTTAQDMTVITVNTNAPLDSNDGKALIDHLRANRAQCQGLTVLVTGQQAGSLDFTRYLFQNFPTALIFILVATYLVLLLMFHSLLLPLKAVLMNVISVAASYGVLVLVFQQGNFAQLLGFTSTRTIDSPVPILLFCIVFGLSMDYEVFLLSRIREEWLRTHDNTYAVAHGLEQTAAAITGAALLFAIFTSSSIFTRLLTTKEIGLGMTFAVLLDATIIRTLLVPATMRLLGRWNWWLPGWPLPKERKEKLVA